MQTAPDLLLSAQTNPLHEQTLSRAKNHPDFTLDRSRWGCDIIEHKFYIMMTRLLLIFDSTTFLTLDVAQPPEQLAAAINQGFWAYPAPLQHIFAEKPGVIFRAVALGSWVFATCDNNKLPPPTTSERLLSPRQTQILNLLSQGLTNKQIAQQLQLAPRTVNLHITEIKRKLDTQTIAQSVVRGGELGYCRIPPSDSI